jgi:hypothetical protein
MSLQHLHTYNSTYNHIIVQIHTLSYVFRSARLLVARLIITVFVVLGDREYEEGGRL